MSYDLVTVGEAMLRLWVPAGERLEDAHSFNVTVAGAEANVAIAVARAGLSAAWLSRLPDSPLGRRAARDLAGHGVDVSRVVWDSSARMGTYFVELSVPPRPVSVVYDRAESAASMLTPDDIAWDVVESARVVHLTGITPAISATARLTVRDVARRAIDAGVVVTFDVNFRRHLWSASEASTVIGELCDIASVVIVTTEDARDLFDIEGSAPVVAAAVRRMTRSLAVVVTDGAAGAAWDAENDTGSAPGHEAGTIDRIGAGDAFAAGVIIGLLTDDIGKGVETGLAMAALKLGIFGDQLVASRTEVAAVVHGGPERSVRR